MAQSETNAQTMVMAASEAVDVTDACTCARTVTISRPDVALDMARDIPHLDSLPVVKGAGAHAMQSHA